MAARLVETLPEGPEWAYEVKFDGYRALLIKNGSTVHLRSRNNKDLARAYPSIVTAARQLAVRQATIDGEIVAVDATGRPSFQALQHRTAHPAHAVVFYAFDLLHLDGRDLSGQTLVERRAQLPVLVNGSAILLSIELPGSSRQVIEAVRQLGLEGVIAKRRDSRYVPGERSTAWLKVKVDRQQEFVIGGFRPGPHGVDALIVGYYEGRALRFAAKVRAGFTPRVRREVAAEIRTAGRDALPVRRSTVQQGVALGRRDHRRADARDAVGAPGPRRPGSLRRMDDRRSPAARGVPRPP